MAKAYDRLIKIQTLDNDEQWSTIATLHASVNHAKQDHTYLGGGATQDDRTLIFETRYAGFFEDLYNNMQMYRIVYNRYAYSLLDLDDYYMQHKTVKLKARSTGAVILDE